MANSDDLPPEMLARMIAKHKELKEAKAEKRRKAREYYTRELKR